MKQASFQGKAIGLRQAGSILLMGGMVLALLLLPGSIGKIDLSYQTPTPKPTLPYNSPTFMLRATLEPPLPDIRQTHTPSLFLVGGICFILLCTTFLLLTRGWPASQRWLTAFSLLFVGAILLLLALRERPSPYTGSPFESDAGGGGGVMPPPTPPPNWLVLLGTILLAASAAILIVWIGWFLWRRMHPKNTNKPAIQIGNAARQALQRLDYGQDWRLVILNCYRDMVRILDEQRSIQRQLGMTPREFGLALEGLGIPGLPVKGLTHLFELVRYGDRYPNASEKDEAIEYLRQIAELCAPERSGELVCASS